MTQPNEKLFSWWQFKIKSCWEQSKNNLLQRNIPICLITFVHNIEKNYGK